MAISHLGALVSMTLGLSAVVEGFSEAQPPPSSTHFSEQLRAQGLRGKMQSKLLLIPICRAQQAGQEADGWTVTSKEMPLHPSVT